MFKFFIYFISRLTDVKHVEGPIRGAENPAKTYDG